MCRAVGTRGLKTTNLDKYSTWLSCSGEFFWNRSTSIRYRITCGIKLLSSCIREPQHEDSVKVANQGCEPVKNLSLLLGGNVMNAAEC